VKQAYRRVLAQASGPTFTLTLQTDTIQTKANNAVFNAPLVSQVATLQTGDSIIDTGSGGTLHAVFNPVIVNLIGAAIQGIPTWNLTNVGTWSAPQWIACGSLVGGLQILNDIRSIAPIVVGVTGASLSHALTTIGLTGTASDLTALIAPSALSGSSNTLTVNLHNAGTSSSGSVLTVGPDGNAANGYDAWHLNATGNNWVTLSQGSATSATFFKISGSGMLRLFGNNGWPNLASVDASTFTGNLFLSNF